MAISSQLKEEDIHVKSLSNSYITSTRDVSGLNCDARGRVAPEGGAI